MLEHWMAVLAPQHVVPDPPRYTACIAHRRMLSPQSDRKILEQECRQQDRELTRRTLDFLIASRWLTGEAAERGVAVSTRDLTRRLAQKERRYANAAEFQEALGAIDHTLADLKFETTAELASEKLARRLSQSEPAITHSEIVDYYRRRIASYHIPEERYFDIGENFHSAAEARRRRAQVAVGEESIHELLPRKPFTDYNGEKRTIYEVIFKAKRHVVSQPVRLNGAYFLINVTRIRPAYVQSLAHVEHAIDTKLVTARRRVTLATFIAAWRAKWTARTRCSPGYVLQKCSEYRGPREAESPNSFS
jgi:PPIC-type PPIASE domain